MQTLGNPEQRAHRIAERRRLDKASKRVSHPRIFVAERLPPAAVATHAPLRQRRAVEIVFSTIDGRTRKPCELGNQRQPATPPPRALPPPQTAAGRARQAS